MDELSKNDIRAILAEFLGTMFFVFLGTGAVISVVAALEGSLTGPALIVISIAHGLGILIAVAWTANISGGHINPVVSLAMIITRNISPTLGVAYMVAQFAGAGVGSLLLKLTTADVLEEGGLGNHAVNDALATGEGLLLEILCTAFLVLVIYNVAVSNKGWGINAPFAIGLSVMLIHFVAVPFTGASVNPARTFGPALIENEWKDFWVYIVGPGIGAVAVAIGWMGWAALGEDDLTDDMA